MRQDHVRRSVGPERAELVDGREEHVRELRLRQEHDETCAAFFAPLFFFAPFLFLLSSSAAAASGGGDFFPEGPHEHGGLGDVLREGPVGRGGERSSDAVLGVVAVELICCCCC